MNRAARMDLFGRAAERFFAGADWLAAGAPVPAFALKVAAGLAQLVLTQAAARWRAVLDAPIGVLPAGYDVPGPDEVLDLFSIDADPPALAEQFRAEVEAEDWEALQRAHRILYEVTVLRRPALQAVFAVELARGDLRGIVEQYDDVAAWLRRITRAEASRRALADLATLVVGAGPERDDAEARAALETHWRALVETLLERPA
ncbi:MAG: hypothetical protein H6704_22055 [Myxococcales bacterium]|nr:hypothetical protein [Myxococcales bacterium]